MQDRRIVLAVVALGLTQIIGWGTTFNLPAVLGPAMATDLAVSLPAIMAGPTVMLVTMAATSWALAPLNERHGPHAVMAAGSAIGAAGLALLAVSPNVFVYYAAWLILGFAGTAMLTTAAQIALAQLAGDKARQAIGGLMLFGGLATTVSWPVANALSGAIGWRGVCLVFALALLLVCVPLHWRVLRRPAPAAAGTAGDGKPVPAVDRTDFALMAVAIAANGFVTWGFSLTIIILLTGRGLAIDVAVSTAAIIGLMQIIARFIDFAGGRRWSSLQIGLAASAALPLSFCILIFGQGLPAALAFVVVYGLAGGMLAVARATIPLHFFPPGAYARASAQLAGPLNLAFAAAPPAFAAILASLGAEAALTIAFAMSLVGFGALACLSLRRRPA
ncbi:transporter [Devosia geojensis]|uniref:Transporter n=1 Tax=Devosia geojensis TaxID=443610 RepID=A0A0F5FW74_9HYPH|nr:MFS transporter [Devosia geojensis]KKB12825.1 transporter [Devosia geojensis]